MSCFRLQTYYLRPVRDDFRSEWTDYRLVMADSISELAGFRPEKLISSLISNLNSSMIDKLIYSEIPITEKWRIDFTNELLSI